jgi:hypothetical protein
MAKGREVTTLARLRQLDGAPDEQAAYAARLVEESHNVEVLGAARDVLVARADPAYRPILLGKYAECAGEPSRRDAGCHTRTAIFRALRPLARPEDSALLAAATERHEFLPSGSGPVEVAAGLRAAALVALNEVDDVLAGFHAARLLTDRHTSPMSGEPATTAARVLASQGQTLPLYAYTIRDGPLVADVVAESLRGLVAMPASLLPAIVARWIESRDEIVLLGLFDLLLAREDRADHTEVIFDFLRTTPLLNTYRYLVSTLIAARDDALVARLTALAGVEANRDKAAILQSTLALR